MSDLALAVLDSVAERLGMTREGLLELATYAPRFVPELPRCCDLDVVAARLDVPRDMLRDLSRKGRFPTLIEIKVGKSVVRIDELVVWLRSRSIGGGA
jgi:hypothetical protein